MGATAPMVGAMALACYPYFSTSAKNTHFSSNSSRFHPDRHFSFVYLQNNQINLKYARNMYKKPKIA